MVWQRDGVDSGDTGKRAGLDEQWQLVLAKRTQLSDVWHEQRIICEKIDVAAGCCDTTASAWVHADGGAAKLLGNAFSRYRMKDT